MLRTVTHADPAALAPLRAQWDALAVATANPYCAPAWMLAWWTHVAPGGARLRVHAVTDGDDLVGLAPFFVDRGVGGVVRHRLLGAGLAAPLDVLARPGRERAVAAEVARALADSAPRADAIMLEGLRGGSAWPALIAESWPRGSAPTVTRQIVQPAPFVELRGGSHAGWLASRSSDFRRKLRRERDGLARHGGELAMSASADEVERDLDDFARLHYARWRARGGSGALDERVERMLRTAGRELVDDGRFRLWSMRVDGRVISSQLFVSAGGETAYWLGGFDERETRVRRPGIVTVLQALEHAFGAGDGLFDLGGGGQQYKHELTRTERTLEWTLLVPRGWRAPLAHAQLARRRARQALAQRLPPSAKRLVRRVLAVASAVRGDDTEGRA